MKEFSDFRNKTIKEIQIWAWIAAVLPITALAGLYFIWSFGTGKTFNIAMIVGETIMFAVAVVWWWWAIYVINRLVKQWDTTRQSVKEVLTDIREVREIVRDQIPKKD